MGTLFGGGDGDAKYMQAQQFRMQQEQQKRLDSQQIEKQRQMAAMAAARRSGGMRQLMAGQTDLGQAGTSTLGTGS